MTFESTVDRRIAKIRETLSAKAKEYASANSRFHNFEVGGRIMGVTPERALQGMMLKHIVSVFDLIDWTATDNERITIELIDEKIGDTINYLILLEGMLKQRAADGGQSRSIDADMEDTKKRMLALIPKEGLWA